MKSLLLRYSLLVFMGLFALWWLHLNWLEKEALELTKDQESVRIGYEASNMMYRLATKEAYDLAINIPEVLSILKEGVDSSGKKRAIARGELYRKLYPAYLSLGSKKLHQLHFHLPDGTSYLRFHKPDRFGDSILEARPSIRIANTTRESVEGFELGKVVSGYRYVHPLVLDGEFLGTVETSVPVKSILDALKDLDESREYAYIINATIAKKLLFKEQTHLYTPSTINPDYYIEDALGELPTSPPPLSEEAKEINLRLASNKGFQEALKSSKPYATFVDLGNESYSVVLRPMNGLERGVEGFLISYQKDATPQILSRDFWTVVILTLIWGVAIFILMYKTHRKNIQILAHKEQLQTMLDTLSEGVYVMDEGGIITEVNATACAILGYKREEMIGFEAHGLFHAHNKKSQKIPLEDCPIYEALLEGSSYRSTEEHFIHKNGSFIDVRVGANPLIEGNKIKSMVTVFSDITQEKADVAHKQLLTQALESSSNAIVITDKDAIIQWANPAFGLLTGFDPSEAIGKKPKDLVFSGKQSQDFYKALWDTITHASPWSGEVVNKRKDGSLYTEELSITPVLGNDGEIAHYIAVKQDVTKRKAYEQKLKDAKQSAEIATQAKTDFLANMSHEIRTPLNAIIGLNELLYQTSLSPRQEDLLKKATDSSRLLLHIVNDILDYSKIEAGELELNKEPTKLGDILNQIESIFNEAAIKKGINLVVQSPKQLPCIIETDSLRLLQVLANLIGNGVKFTHEGSVELKVTVLRQSVKNATFFFEVVDTGIGMSQKQMARVLEPFAQADTSITRRYGGSGLGLSIASHLVRALGGDLKINSKEGEGTKVSFQIDAPVVSWENEDEVVAHEDLPNLKGCSVLIIEDNPINQEVAKKMCEHVGVSVDVAGDGEEGYEMYKKEPQKYNCILMDLQMPVMNGYEATAKIREIDPFVPIVALTAAVSTEDRKKVLAAKMNDHLGKPIDSKRLYRHLDKWCKIHSKKTPLAHKEHKESKPSILIVDDEPNNIQVLSKILQDEYRIKIASSGEMALRAMRAQPDIELVLLDIMMPDIDGYTVCKKLKENPQTINVPIIFTTAKTQPDEEAYGLSLGAADYLTKPYHPAVVQARVRHQIEFQRRQEELEGLSMMDGLTKIPNRRYFDEHYETIFRQSVREGSVFALMMIDIDYFKPYNDNYGHGQGDWVLAQVAKALQNALKRPNDKVFRYGGEEFAIILSDIGESGAMQVAENLRQSVEGLQISHAHSRAASVVTVSLGWVLKTASCDVNKTVLFRYADEALYEAKSAGRNCVVMYEVAMEHKGE